MKNVFNFDLVEEFMEKNALTKKQFCLKCNVSQATFSKMEEGDWDIKIGDIFKLIDFINENKIESKITKPFNFIFINKYISTYNISLETYTKWICL